MCRDIVKFPGVAELLFDQTRDMFNDHIASIYQSFIDINISMS